MPRPPKFSRWIPAFLTAAVVALALPSAAQIPSLPTETATKSQEETPDKAKARLDQWLAEALATQAKLNDAAAAANLPAGVEAGALEERRRNVDETVRGIGRTQSLITILADTRKAADLARAATKDWNGFEEKRPYSILLVDELASQRGAVAERAAAYRSSASLLERALEGLHPEARAAEETIRAALGASDAAGGADPAAKWRTDAAQDRARMLAVRANSLRASLNLLIEQQEVSKAELELLDRKLLVASKHAVFTQEDIDKVSKATADRSAAIQKEITTVRQRQRDAMAERERAKATVDRLTPADPATTAPPELPLAALRLATAETKVDAMQFISDTLESLQTLENYTVSSYEARKALLAAKTAITRGEALDTLRKQLDRLHSWEIFAKNELDAGVAELSERNAATAAIPADDPRFPILAAQRTALIEKQTLVQRVAQSASFQSKTVERWLRDHDSKEAQRPLGERAMDAGSRAWNTLRKIWSFEVFQYDKTVIEGGVPFTSKRGVPLGNFIIALFLFVIAYRVASRLSRRMQSVFVSRGSVAEAQANTLRNWLMIVIGAALVMTTLHFLSIPLTVFAFFGGALAIGLGFGTQTLIKNFISGIIVLFERRIRVGDIVDIGGLSGSVSEINTRSSVLRGADGRETLVPNSIFLESSVTNLTLSNRTSRRAVNVGVEYGTQPQLVNSILTDCAERHGLILKDPAPLVVLVNFADTSLQFRLYFWTSFDGKTNAELVESDIRTMILKRFEDAHIGFPINSRPLQVELTQVPATETKPDAGRSR